MAGTNAKRQGNLYEQKFVVKSLEHNLEPHLSPGDYLPHDVLVTNPAGKVFKVQVKGTACEMKDPTRQSNRYRITAASGCHSKVALDCTKVDVLAAYIEPMDIWYIIPCLQLMGRKAAWFYPANEKSKAFYERFKENWGLFLT